MSFEAYTIRLWVNGELVRKQYLTTGMPADLLGELDVLLIAGADTWLLEAENMLATDPEHRFFRMGTDTAGMVDPQHADLGDHDAVMREIERRLG